jgi:exopolysaccharide biosynthesis polyprenyl glycosylphosphotransferase
MTLAERAAAPLVRRGDDVDTWHAWYIGFALVLDFLSVFAGALVGYVLRFSGAAASSATPYIVLTIFLPFLWLLNLRFCGAYERSLIGVGSEEFHRVFNAGFVLISSVAIFAYAAQIDVARSYVILALPFATLLNLASRYALRKRLHKARSQGRCMRRVIAVGHRTAVAELIQQLRREPYHGMVVVGVCVPEGVDAVEGAPVYGGFGDAAMALALADADTVAVLACPELDGTALRRLAWQLEPTGADLVVAPALMDVAGPRISIRPVAGLPLLHVDHPQLAGGGQLLKSLFDRGMAVLALLLLSPVLAGMAVAIRLGGDGPALFRQTRIGKDGRPFVVLKFRTMVLNAEELRTGLVADTTGVLFKIKNDPRITRVGRFLRRHSLDELPQLINVLRGDMSLVGPRPPLREEVEAYGDGDVRRRLVVKPGMTGLWQVSGRSDLSWDESVRLDLRYVENWSLALDLLIIWKTWSAVIKGSGAY